MCDFYRQDTKIYKDIQWAKRQFIKSESMGNNNFLAAAIFRRLSHK